MSTQNDAVNTGAHAPEPAECERLGTVSCCPNACPGADRVTELEAALRGAQEALLNLGMASSAAGKLDALRVGLAICAHALDPSWPPQPRTATPLATQADEPATGQLGP